MEVIEGEITVILHFAGCSRVYAYGILYGGQFGGLGFFMSVVNVK